MRVLTMRTKRLVRRKARPRWRGHRHHRNPHHGRHGPHRRRPGSSTPWMFPSSAAGSPRCARTPLAGCRQSRGPQPGTAAARHPIRGHAPRAGPSNRLTPSLSGWCDPAGDDSGAGRMMNNMFTRQDLLPPGRRSGVAGEGRVAARLPPGALTQANPRSGHPGSPWAAPLAGVHGYSPGITGAIPGPTAGNFRRTAAAAATRCAAVGCGDSAVPEPCRASICRAIDLKPSDTPSC